MGVFRNFKKPRIYVTNLKYVFLVILGKLLKTHAHAHALYFICINNKFYGKLKLIAIIVIFLFLQII